MKPITEILRSNASKHDVEFDFNQKSVVYRSMADYANLEVKKYRSREISAELPGFFKTLFSMTWDNWILYFRHQSFKKAKKAAQLRANTEGYKVYAIRSGLVSYTLLSTLEVRHNKRIRVLGKNVDAMKLTETADFVAYPKR